MDLFSHTRQKQIQQESPLANRMRPRTLDEYIGQEHIIGPGRLLRRAIQADQLSSLIFYGPPGTGKTTLAMVIANQTRSHFITINAVLAGVKEIREAIENALERRNLYNQRTTLFVDEVHRWNKAQQDALLPHVENGMLILIGATTENPYFEVNKALVSRSRIFQLRPLTPDHLRQVAQQTLSDSERGYGKLKVWLQPEALEHLVNIANGDARALLNALELAVETTPTNDQGIIAIDLAVAEESIQRRAVLYDKDGDAHYDTISAFIKSLRGSDPDAALYWLAKMVYAGEDPRFIFRRMAILAGEDVGLADPAAAGVVNDCWALYERIGLPEGRFHLAQATVYLATCPKSNSTLAFFDALATVEKEQEGEVPNHLKDGNRDSQGFGHGQGYLYPHAYRDHWAAQQYLPASLQGKLFYQPSEQGYEKEIAQQVRQRREIQLAAMLEGVQEQPLEVWTTSPMNKGKEAWLQRVSAGISAHLAQLRQKLFALAMPKRHERVLVVGDSTGLLVWEAVRQTPEGGVWLLVNDSKVAEMLRQQASRLPELERPQILVGTLVELADILTWRGETDLRFELILGRNLLPLSNGETNLSQLEEQFVHWLAPSGRTILAQVIPRWGQRLYRLIDWAGVPASLYAQVVAAEEEIYTDPTDRLVNWELPAQLAGWQIEQTEIVEERRISPEMLDRWFGEGKQAGERLSYRQRLKNAGITPADLTFLATLYRTQLTQHSIQWHSTVGYLSYLG